MLTRSASTLAVALLALVVPSAWSQASSTASRRFDLQAGLGVVLDHSDYEPQLMKGGAFYATLDFTNHFGAEINFHQANTAINTKVYERTYEVGGRYFRTYGRFKPYAKLIYGRGVFNFPQDAANLAYNIFAGGIGTDVAVLRNVNVRADYEFQSWRGFPPHGLNPQLLTIGVAYHFPGGLRRGKYWK